MKKEGGIIRVAVGFFVLLFSISLVLASSIPIYVKPLSGDGSLNPNKAYSYNFYWTTDSSCSNVVFSSAETITTGVDGVGFVNVSLPDNLASVPSYLCEYRDGTLRKVHELPVQFPDKVYTKKINATGDIYSSGVFYGSGSGLTNVNAAFLGSYNANFFMPLNTSLSGNFDFNGGWTAGGSSIIGGDIYAQNVYTYSLSNLNVSTLNINGSLIPESAFDNQFDLGSSAIRWQNLYLGGDLHSDGNIYENGNLLSSIYYSKSNPFSFYNSTTIPDYALNSALSDYYLTSNPSGYVTWAQVTNGTVGSGSGITWAQAVNGTLASLSTILGFSYYNSTTLPGGSGGISWAEVINGTVYLSSNPANYATWANVVNGTVGSGGGITWANAVNGTLLTTALYNSNYSANDAAYRGATNTSYALVSEPLWTVNYTNYNSAWSSITNTSYLTATFFNANYSANDAIYRSITNISYYLATNPFGYYNSTNPPPSSGITWAQATNGTLLSASLFNANYTANDAIYRGATNTSYYLATNPYGYLNTTTNTSYYLATNPFSFYNSTTIPVYATWADVVNGTVGGGGITWEQVVNGTLMPQTTYNANYSNFYPNILNKIAWANAMNGTLMSQATFNTNYSTNDFIYRSFAANYSTFLTHIDWAKAVNGTLLSASSFNANYSINDAIYRSITNTSYYLATNPSSYINWANAVNGTLFTTALHNANYSATDLIYRSFASNYSTFLTHINWANVVNGTVYLASNPNSYINWANALNGTLYLASNPSGYLTNSSMNKSVSCSDIIGPDSDFCIDSGAGGGISWAEATNGTLASLSTVLGFSYYNSTNPPPGNGGSSSYFGTVKTNQVWIDEFCTINANQQDDFWGMAVSSGTITSQTADQWHPCVLALQDSTTANGGYLVGLHTAASQALLLINGSEVGTFIFQPKTATTRWIVKMGFLENAAVTEPLDGCFFEMIDNGNISGSCRSNNAETATATVLTPVSVTTWYKGVISINPTASQVTFTIYNSTMGNTAQLWTDTISSNIPTATGRETSFGVIATQNSTAAGQPLIWMDYMELNINRTLVR
ncbi:MAG: hypothetical protein PHH00_02285 [Candidatus Nanoarchaeia archaeon]|nr:hypothetical protein [Candidatus Nanoarchaeia archaeon]